MKCNKCNQSFKAKEITKVPFKANANSAEVQLSFCATCLMDFVTKQTGATEQKQTSKIDKMIEPEWSEKEMAEYEAGIKERKKNNVMSLLGKNGRRARKDTCPHEKISLIKGQGYVCVECKKPYDTTKLDRQIKK